jgi:hypothetical protein
MPVWLVKATWIEDEAEASEQWEVNAETAHDAVKAVSTHIRFRPHHVEARLCSAEAEKTKLSRLTSCRARHAASPHNDCPRVASSTRKQVIDA